MGNNPNSITNNELSHKGFGVSSMGMLGNGKQALGISSDSPYLGENMQLPAYSVLRQLLDTSPFAFRVVAMPVLGGDLAGVALTRPSVLYSPDGFGSERLNPRTRSRLYRRWRMYVQETVGDTIYMVESDDGIDWSATPEQITTLPNGVNYPLGGMNVFYDSDGLVTYDDGGGAVTYNFATIVRDAALNAGDATDMILCLSNCGITWTQVVMANHDVSGDPFGAELANALGRGAAYMAKQDTSLTFSATLPRTFFGSDGWHSFMRYQDEPVNLGDTLFGCTIMGQNSSDNTDANEIGHFANWNRNLLRQVGERSFGQATKMNPHHIVKYKDIYLALTQLYWHEAGTANLVNTGLGLAISKDGLIFESCGPLYDAGLVYALNDRTSVVDQTDMDPTSYLANQGVGDGSQIVAGSLVVDQDGLAFGRDCGHNNNRAFIRVYWTEEDADRILIGEL